MDSQLFTLSKIFTERLFRIPDYQRGYAWTEPQWKDFWNDINQIEEGSNHYTGVLTLETVPRSKSSSWHDDIWIIDSKGYEPFYVVDGQQRLTTSIVLIQVILEAIPEGMPLNYTEASEIRRKFTFESKDSGISRSYIFGYDKDNPIYEFLKTKIFGEFSSSGGAEETIYTNNLENAKGYFKDRVISMEVVKLEVLYKKITQNLLFNIFTISKEVDVCVAFETMNNRGKPLSDLELLKNRLIYLSLKVDESDVEKDKLRRSVNDCWKAIYHNLGRNKYGPLDDDIFLRSHYRLYFLKVDDLQVDEPADAAEELQRLRHERRLLRYKDHYNKLLEEIFVSQRVINSELTVSDIHKYVSSLQASVEHWYDIFNPLEGYKSAETGVWLDKLDRIGNTEFLPLILSVLLRVEKNVDQVQIFQKLERYIFLNGLAEYNFYARIYESGFLKEAVDLYNNIITAEQLATRIGKKAAVLLDAKGFLSDMRSYYKSRGYYNWKMIRYFLYEYNLDLQIKSKTERKKIHWPEYAERKTDFKTIEHIYPQNARAKYWTERFVGMTPKQRDYLRNSLGNLLPLSQPKNARYLFNPVREGIGRVGC